MLSVLVIEHDPAVAELARRYLAREGFTVRLAGTPGEAAEAFAEAGPGGYSPDAVVLDLTMPGLKAREIRRALSEPEAGRGRGARPALVRPLVCLAGPGGLRAREVGAPGSTCLRRPFGPRSLVARVRAALAAATGTRSGDASGTGRHAGPGARRTSAVTGQRQGGDGAVREPAEVSGARGTGGTATGGNPAMQRFADVALTATERDLLAFLLANPGRVFTRERLLAAVWGTADGHLTGLGTGQPAGSLAGPGGRPGGQRSRRRGAPAGPRAVDVYVAQLRAKLGDRSPIRTVRGIGYSAQP